MTVCVLGLATLVVLPREGLETGLATVPQRGLGLPPMVAASLGAEAWMGNGVLESSTLQGSYPLDREGTN